MELTESYLCVSGVITVSNNIIKHNRKKSKHNRGNFWKIPKKSILSKI